MTPPSGHSLAEAVDRLPASVWHGLESRLKAQGLRPGTINARREEWAYLVGAMIVINALFPNDDPTILSPLIPPGWVLLPMSGRSILEFPPKD